jgi:hypothetical protein
MAMAMAHVEVEVEVGAILQLTKHKAIGGGNNKKAI